MTEQDINEMARALKEILDKLDKAIVEAGKDANNVKMADVTKILQSNLVKMNKRYDGNGYDVILAKLDKRIADITEKVRTDKKLDVAEAKKLAEIRKEIQKGKEPFQKTRDVIKSLEAKGYSKEELRNRKEAQKIDKTAQMKANQKMTEDLAFGMADIEAKYINPINQNKESCKIITEMAKKRVLIDTLDPQMDKDRIKELKDEIKSNISQLSARGLDVTSLNGFESNLNLIDNFANTQVPIIEQNSRNIAINMATDKTIPSDLRNQFNLGSVRDVKSLEEKYNNMSQTRMSYATKAVTLKNEIDQIDNIIKEMKRDDYLKSVAYKSDGTLKSNDEIADEVFYNPKMVDEIEDRLTEKYGDGLFRSFRSRKNYYKEQEGKGIFASIKATWKALFNSSNKVALLASRTEAAKYGKDGADKAVKAIETRKASFQKTLKQGVQTRVAKNPSLSEDKIKDGLIDKAYEQASEHIEIEEDNERG